MYPLIANVVEMSQASNYFVGWGTLSLINAGLVHSKNRSGFLWWLASLLLGPIATFLIVILDRVPVTSPRLLPEKHTISEL